VRVRRRGRAKGGNTSEEEGEGLKGGIKRKIKREKEDED
jgi:hypothetical protein